jgi:heptosyltransferase-2
VFINIEAKGPRQLAAMAANCTFYFGNEGGARHIVQAMGRPSLVVCSPMASKRTWLPENDEVLTRGIAAADLADVGGMSYKEQYDLITVERVWEALQTFYSQISKQK